jgi:hypothetical protein
MRRAFFPHPQDTVVSSLAAYFEEEKKRIKN